MANDILTGSCAVVKVYVILDTVSTRVLLYVQYKNVILSIKILCVCNTCLYTLINCLWKVYTKVYLPIVRAALHLWCNCERFYFLLPVDLSFLNFKKKMQWAYISVNVIRSKCYHYQTHYLNRVGLLRLIKFSWWNINNTNSSQDGCNLNHWFEI